MTTAAQLLLEDSDLGAGLDEARFAQAEREVRAAVVVLPRGPWVETTWRPSLLHGMGLMLLDGTVLRRRGLEGRSGGELLGAGDIVRPWQPEDALVGGDAAWQALTRTRLALLDVDFVRRLQAYPEIAGALMARSVARSRNLGVTIAILHQPRVDIRLRMLLWHYADRWGHVRPDGVHLPLPLTHELLSSLVAARRPTVSTALSELQRQGALQRLVDGWLLRGSRPGELAEVAPEAGPEIARRVNESR